VRGGALLAGVGAVGILLLAHWQPGTVAEAGAQPAGPRYWTTDRLDVRPQIKTHVMPEYPAELPSGVNGRVVLELYISPQGTLDRVRVVRAEPPGRFEDSALKAFSAARFTPGLRKGKPVRSLLRVEVTYGD
jgi:periplasmic protein TonB